MLKRVFYVIVIAAMFTGCDDDIPPVGPDSPPQINVTRQWAVTFDGAGNSVSIHTNDVYDILVTSENEVWIASSGGIAIFKEDQAAGAATTRTRAYTNTNGLPNPKVRRMIEYNGRIFVATWGGGVGVYEMADSSWTALALRNGSIPGLLNPLVNDIEVINDRIYFATNSGATIYDPALDTYTNFAKAEGLSYPTFSTLRCPDCPLEPLVSAIASGTTTSRGLEIWYGIRVEFGLIPTRQANYGVTVDLPSGPHVIYKVNLNGLPELTANDVYFDETTEHFWLAMASKGLVEVDVATGVWKRHTAIEGLPSNTTYSIAEAGGRLWAATQAGVAAQKNDGRWQGYGRGAGLKEVRIRRVYSDDGVRLWVATFDGGAMLLDPSTAERL